MTCESDKLKKMLSATVEAMEAVTVLFVAYCKVSTVFTESLGIYLGNKIHRPSDFSSSLSSESFES